jgi:hypothetical protein
LLQNSLFKYFSPSFTGGISDAARIASSKQRSFNYAVGIMK